MTSTLRHTAGHTARRGATTLAALAFAAAGLTACGSDGGGDASSAPSSVSTDDFCTAYSSYFKEIAKAGTGSDSDVVPAIKDFASKLSDLGTPKDIPADARNGFEVSIKQAQDLPDDASLDDLSKLETDVSADDQKDVTAFGTYVQDTCPNLLKDLVPSGVPTS